MLSSSSTASTGAATSTSTGQRLHLELQDMIIDKVKSEGELAALRTCLLVSRSFRDRALRYIFKKVCLCDTPKPSGPELWEKRVRLLSQIAASALKFNIPNPFSHIQKVFFSFDLARLSVSTDEACVSDLAQNISVILDAITKYSQKLQEFNLTSNVENAHDPYYYSDWAQLPHCVQSSLIKLACAHRLKSLCLQFITNIPRCLLWGSTMSELVIWGEVAQDEPTSQALLDDDNGRALTLPAIQKIETTVEALPSVIHLYPGEDRTAGMSVVSLHFNIDIFIHLAEANAATLADLKRLDNAARSISVAYPSLKELSIDFTYCISAYGNPYLMYAKFDITSLKELNSLHLTFFDVSYKPDVDGPDRTVPYVTELVAFLTRCPSSLTLITWELGFDILDKEDDSHLWNLGEEWRELDAVLKKNFPNLKGFHLHLQATVYNSEPPVDEDSLLKDAHCNLVKSLPFLASRLLELHLKVRRVDRKISEDDISEQSEDSEDPEDHPEHSLDRSVCTLLKFDAV